MALADRVHALALEVYAKRPAGVAPTASQSEIRAAYRRLALEHHPDRNTRGVDRMARVNAAYAVLDSPRARRSYDYDLRFGRFDGARRRGAEAAD